MVTMTMTTIMRNGTSTSKLMMTIAVMTMTAMVVEVLDGDSGKDRQ